MNVRKLLQTELWSKRTSRRILVWFGLIFGVLVVGFVAVYEIERHWLTPGERSSAKAALAQIDGLQDFGSLSDQEFEVREKQAEVKVKIAKDAAVTKRDVWIADSLELYLTETQGDFEEIQIAIVVSHRF